MNPEMNIPNWEKKYEIGIPDIDFQHKYFLQLIKRFYLRANSGMQKELIASHLDEIILFAQFHFCSEENLMKLHGYPGFKEHQKSHENIIQLLSDKLGLFELNELSCNEITLFLIDWFQEHTVKEDIKIAPYINN